MKVVITKIEKQIDDSTLVVLEIQQDWNYSKYNPNKIHLGEAELTQ